MTKPEFQNISFKLKNRGNCEIKRSNFFEQRQKEQVTFEKNRKYKTGKLRPNSWT